MAVAKVDLEEVTDRYAYEEDRAGFLTECVRKHGDVVPLKRDVFLVSGPEFVERVLTGTNKHFAGPADFLRRELEGTSDSPDLLRWMQARGAAIRGLNKGAVKASASRFLELAPAQFATWEPGKPIDVVSEMERLAAPIVPDYCFGTAGLSLVRPLGKLFNSLTPLVSSPFSFPSWLPIPRNIHERHALRKMEGLVDEIIAERRAQNLDSSSSNLLEALISADLGSSELPDRVMRGMLLAAMLAGYGVPPLALSWTWYLLAREPDRQERLHAEVEHVVGDPPPSVEHLQELRYTNAIVKESLRLYPPVWLVARRTVIDCEFGPYSIRPGQYVMVSAFTVHRDGRYFERPDEFRPERWLTRETANLPKFAYFPFGGGPRICIGYTLALSELVLLAAEISRRFVLTVPSPERVRLQSRRMLVPNGLVGVAEAR